MNFSLRLLRKKGHEKSSSQRRFGNRINPYGEGAAGTVLSRALEAGAANVRTGEEVRRALGQSGSGTLGSSFGALEERTAGEDRGSAVNSWKHFAGESIANMVDYAHGWYI